MDSRPRVLFVCVHNAGRSQMAAALTEMHAGGQIDIHSAGSEPSDQVNPMAVEAMAELGVDIVSRTPKLLSNESVRASDVVITMGCGDACPVYPGKQYLDWDLDDPAGKDLETVREIRNEINRRVLDLVQSLLSNGSDWERPAELTPD
ncbi:MAG: arsenate reductase ArsC [Acidimicrobiia bacterium]